MTSAALRGAWSNLEAEVRRLQAELLRVQDVLADGLGSKG